MIRGNTGCIDHLADNFRNGFVLENSAIKPLRKQPEHRYQIGVKDRPAANLCNPGEPGENAADLPGLGSVFDGEHCRLAEHLFGFDVITFGLEIKLESKQLRQSFGSLEIRYP